LFHQVGGFQNRQLAQFFHEVCNVSHNCLFFLSSRRCRVPPSLILVEQASSLFDRQDACPTKLMFRRDTPRFFKFVPEPTIYVVVVCLLSDLKFQISNRNCFD
jgi:hypothetical protein